MPGKDLVLAIINKIILQKLIAIQINHKAYPHLDSFLEVIQIVKIYRDLLVLDCLTITL
jgi:hypothetical protein